MNVFPNEAEIREPLLAFLQETLGSHHYAQPPSPMAPGNDTQVHSLRLDDGGPLVLRVFRRGSDPRRATFESTVQNALAVQGLPVPRAMATCTDPDVIGAPFFVMERLPGTPLYGTTFGTDGDGIPRAHWRRMLRQGGGMLFDLPKLLAEVDLRIHGVETKPVIEALEAAGLSWQEVTASGRIRDLAGRIDAYSLEGLRPGLNWLREHPPETASDDVVCHGDMQPLNLLIDSGQLSGIVDWANMSLGPPELQIGWTRAMYLTIELPLPGPVRFLERRIAEHVSSRYTGVYGRARKIDRDVLGYYEALRSLYGLGFLGEMVVRRVPIRDAWNSPSAIARVVAHVRERTGVEVSIPWLE